MMNLKTTVTLFFMFLGMAAWAAEANLSAIENLRKSYQLLAYDKAADNQAGYDRLTEVIAILESFEKNQKANKKANKAEKEEFEALVLLVGEALPYDPESSVAGTILAIADEHPELRKTLSATLPKIESTCRRQRFENALREMSCVSKDMRSGQYEKFGQPTQASSCDKLPIFNFETCLANERKQGSTPAAKSREPARKPQPKK